MKKKSAVVTGIFIISTAIQLVSQVIVTRLFGAGTILDNFLAAAALPTIIVTVIYGTLNDLFLPFYGREKIKNPKLANGKLWWGVIGFAILALVFSALLSVLSPFVVKLLYPPTSGLDGGVVSRQLSFLVFSFPLAVIATLFGTYFYAKKAYFNFPVVQTVGSLVNLLIFLALFKPLGIWSLVIAFVGNILFQIPLVLPRMGLRVVKFNLIPLFLAWIPLILANFFIRSDTLIIRSFGSTIGVGYLVYLNLVSKVFALSTSLLTIGIQIVLLPNLVELLAIEEHHLAIKIVNKTKLAAIALSIFGVTAVYLFSPHILKFLFLGGKFTALDLEKTVALLPYFVVPAIGWGIVSIFFQPLVAKRKFVELASVSAASLAAAWLVGSMLLNAGFGVLAITVALSILLFGCVFGSEIVWQKEVAKHQK